MRPWRLLAAFLLTAALLAAFGVLSVQPLWPTTPPDVQPPVKVSLLDLLQVRSLTSSARKLAATGDFEGSLRAWEQAIANNRGDADVWREALSQLRDSPRIHLPLTHPLLAGLPWYLMLARTNEMDCLVASEVCERYGDHERLLVLPLPASGVSPGQVQAARLKALFNLGRMHEFVPLLKEHEKNVESEPGFELYRLAYEAGWGDSGEGAVARLRLQEACLASGTAPVAAHLELIVANRLADADGAVRALGQLEAMDGAGGLDHALAWLTLLREGRRDEAAGLAAQYSGAPASANELSVMATAFMELGLFKRCQEMLRDFAQVFGRSRTPESANLWMTYAGLLERSRDWEGMRRLSGLLSSLPGQLDWLEGYAAYLEGFAARRLAQTPLARTRFREALKAGFPVGNLGIAAANGMLTAHQPAMAEEVLASVEPMLQHTPAFWSAVWNTALHLHGDDGRLLEAATRLHEFEPGDAAARFNLAAALLIRRERASEALGLLWDLRQNSPGSLFIELNYAQALVQNGRQAEAFSLLSTLNPAALTDTEKPTYQLCMLEIHQRSGRTDEARRLVKAIDRSRFFPSQIRWLESVEAGLAAAP